MKTKPLLFIFIALVMTTAFLPLTFGKDYWQWHLPDGTLARLGKGNVNDVAFSPDNTRLAVASSVGIWIYDVQTYEEIALLASDTLLPTYSLLFKGNPELFTPEEFPLLEAVGQAAHSVDFSSDGQTLASVSIDSTIRLWDTATGELRKILADWTHSFPSNVAFSSDGAALASRHQDGAILLWDTRTGEIQKTLLGHTDLVNGLAFNVEGTMLASGGEDSTVLLWDVTTGDLRKTLQGHTSLVLSVSFGGDRNTLATGSKDKTIRLWDASTGEHLKTLSGHTGEVASVSFSSDGKMLASGGEDGAILLWEVTTGNLRSAFTRSLDAITSVSFSSDDRRLASGSHNYLLLWDVPTGAIQKSFTGDTEEVLRVAFSQDRKTLENGEAALITWPWNVTTDKIRGILLEHAGYSGAPAIAYSSESRTLAIGSWVGDIQLMDVDTNTRKRLRARSTGRVSVALNSDGTTLASAGENGDILLWDVATGKRHQTLTGSPKIANIIAFNGDNSILAGVRWDNIIHLWNVSTGEILKTAVSMLRDTEQTPEHMRVDEHIRRIERGYFNEVSVGYSGGEEKCDICGLNIWRMMGDRMCPHWPGEVYDGELCTYTIRDANLREISLVSRGANPEAQILQQRRDDPEFAKLKQKGAKTFAPANVGDSTLPHQLSEGDAVIFADGETYRARLFDTLCEEGTRAMGNRFDVDSWRQRIATWDAAAIEEQIDIFMGNADGLFPVGRQTTDSTLPGRVVTMHREDLVLPGVLFS